jgi:Uncharacterized conserved protein (DUF2075)
MNDAYFAATLEDFLAASDEAILGKLTQAHNYSLEQQQRDAWRDEVRYLRSALSGINDAFIFLEFSIPRMGKRADALILHEGIIFVVEFKVNSSAFDSYAIDQVHDYALDLKNFHLGSHTLPIVPVLIATKALGITIEQPEWAVDGVSKPILVGQSGLAAVLAMCNQSEREAPHVDVDAWRSSGYRPTPTIIEAAQALYRNHAVEEISRSDASAKNLQTTSDKIAEIIERSKLEGRKSICFITGVPGAGKTLAGLNIAAKRSEKHEDEHAVFLSGNGPLVDVLREALARDQVAREGSKKTNAHRSVRGFVQNIHHFRDHYVGNDEQPFEKVVVFDEAQRAWTSDQASKFMQTKRGHDGFNMSEPEFLISVMARHADWCTVICLIGGGQEINTGEAGLSEWLAALQHRFADWDVHASSLLDDHRYTIDAKATDLLAASHIEKHPELHLSVSMRSFRAELVSSFVSLLLDGDAAKARNLFNDLSDRYPIILTRDLSHARAWLKEKARGTERYGLVASAGGCRLRPEGIHVKSKIEPTSYFLNDRFDVRSSYYLEEVATQFDIQGLELDWTCVCWDADLRRADGAWQHYAFKGTKWQQVRNETNQLYLLNAYRVLLTRARQGMIVFVPRGDAKDATRPPAFYDEIYSFLVSCGIPELK